MTIILIRHEKVDMTWDKKYNSATYDLACGKYDKCPVIADRCRHFKPHAVKTIYISELLKTYETAHKLFGDRHFEKTSFINEVPLRSFKDTEKMYPLWLWNFMGRLQWFMQNKRQAESRKETMTRADKMIDLLEQRGEDCYIVTHGFYMRTLLTKLKKRKYRIKRNRVFGISNLDEIIAIK